MGNRSQIARELGINDGTLGHWCAQERSQREGTSGLSVEDNAELKRLRSENAKLRMARDVLKRSVVFGYPEFGLTPVLLCLRTVFL